MIKIDPSKLNPLEQRIHRTLTAYAENHPAFTIKEAAELCDCSISKISKFVNKLGFGNYKQFVGFLYGTEVVAKQGTNELVRIKHFVEDFDYALVDEFYDLLCSYQKIVFFGYGSSLLCGRYFEYRLRSCTNKNVFASSEESMMHSILDKNTLLIILTVTGAFKSFEHLYDIAGEKGCKVVMLVEEYNRELMKQCDKMIWLCKESQPAHLKPYEKSRTVFFIFLEEVIQKLQDTIDADLLN